MAKLAWIGKYPPLEGGIAAKTYWLTNDLAAKGHEVQIIADAVDPVDPYTIKYDGLIPCHGNVTINRSDLIVPWHIPNDRHRVLSLLDKLIEVIEEKKPELIIANYLAPYGLIAFLANRITGVPYVLFHGGSDVRKFVQPGVWAHLWPQALSGAKWIVSDIDNFEIVRTLASHVKLAPPYIPSPFHFHPSSQVMEERKDYTLALIGKSNYYWTHKGWHHIPELYRYLENGFNLVIVSQGKGFETFKNDFVSKVSKGVTWRDFVPPWDMPSFLNSVDGVFCFEESLPFPAFSNLALEAIACGKTVFVNQASMIQHYLSHGVDLSSNMAQIVKLDAEDPRKAAAILTEHFPHKVGMINTIDPLIYDKYLDSVEQIIWDSCY